jgi:predicted nucleotidyltransferase
VKSIRLIDFKTLSESLRKVVPEIAFAGVYGFSSDGKLSPGSDIDVAVYLKEKNFSMVSRILEVLDSLYPGLIIDLTILNDAGIILRFEVLRGKFFLINDWNLYAWFYSLTCREYEDEISWRDQQLAYRDLQ